MPDAVPEGKALGGDHRPRLPVTNKARAPGGRSCIHQPPTDRPRARRAFAPPAAAAVHPQGGQGGGGARLFRLTQTQRQSLGVFLARGCARRRCCSAAPALSLLPGPRWARGVAKGRGELLPRRGAPLPRAAPAAARGPSRSAGSGFRFRVQAHPTSTCAAPPRTASNAPCRAAGVRPERQARKSPHTGLPSAMYTCACPGHKVKPSPRGASERRGAERRTHLLSRSNAQQNPTSHMRGVRPARARVAPQEPCTPLPPPMIKPGVRGCGSYAYAARVGGPTAHAWSTGGGGVTPGPRQRPRSRVPAHTSQELLESGACPRQRRGGRAAEARREPTNQPTNQTGGSLRVEERKCVCGVWGGRVSGLSRRAETFLGASAGRRAWTV